MDYYWVALIVSRVLVNLARDVVLVLLVTFAFSMAVIKCVEWLVRSVYYMFWDRRRVNKSGKKNKSR